MCSMAFLGDLSLPGDEGSVAGARHFVRELLGPGHPAYDDAELCVSELVTNSVVHTRSACAGGRITVIVTAGPGVVQISVLDDGADTKPRICDGPMDEHGRGLVIVDALADEWGVDVTESHTATWFRISFPRPA